MQQYFLLHPVLSNEHAESNELLRKFMCIGNSFSAVLELGAVKLKTAEMDEDSDGVEQLVMSLEITSIDLANNPIIEKIISKFGWDLEPKRPCDLKSAQMIACLLKNERFDVLEHVVLTSPASVSELSTMIA